MKKNLSVEVLFIAIFIVLVSYYLVIKDELYESRTALVVRDLSSSTSASGIGLSLLGMGSSSQVQDSLVVEEYLLSLDVFTLLDAKFHLTDHFKSEDLDVVERLASDASVEKTLEFYRKRLLVDYDESSGILHIAYAHTNPKISQQVLEFLIKHVEEQFNEFNRRKARKQLVFIQKQYKKQKKQMEQSLAALEKYQNEHQLLDPNNSALSSSSIIATLEASLTQKRTELSTLRGYLNENNYEIKKVKSEIKSIKNSIAHKKRALSGKDTSSLNKILFEYEKLKMTVDFDTEVYKNTLLQLESTRIDTSKAAKTLSIVSRPNMPDGYTYPDKPKTFITILIAMLMLYGIVIMLMAIVRDHQE